MSDQYLRKVGLVVTKPSAEGPTPSGAALGSSALDGIDLSEMRIVFKTTQSDVQTPNTAFIRVYNLSDQTAQSIQQEFTGVMLQAGYETGAFGIIFRGSIKQVRRGRENPTDTYLDILAADGDIPYNQGVVNISLAAGATEQDRLDAVAKSMGLPKGYVLDLPPGKSIRGQVLYGMGRAHLSEIAQKANARWSIQNGQLQMVSQTGYRPGTAIVLNSNTGMIGLPQQTQGGIDVTCLLNPNIKIAGLVQIDNGSIQRSLVGGVLLRAPATAENPTGRADNLPGFLPKLTSDGFYMVMVCEHEGDTRGQPWYSKLTCLAVDKSSPADKSVAEGPFGAPSITIRPIGGGS
jgi:hypothetical protein